MAVNVTQWMACFNMSTMDFSRGRLPIHAARFVSLSDLVWGSNNDLEMVLSAAMATLSFRHFFYGPNKNDRSVKTRSSYRQRPELSAEYWGRRPGFLVIFSFLVFFLFPFLSPVGRNPAMETDIDWHTKLRYAEQLDADVRGNKGTASACEISVARSK